MIDRAKGLGESIKDAARAYRRSRTFTSADEIGKENILNKLKADFRATYDEMRKKMGRFDKGESIKGRLKWDDAKSMWSFTSSDGTKYFIDISNSPQQAFIF